MRAAVRNYMAAAKKRREETDEAGFSLIELIVVVVILGILAAVAIPIFGGIQKSAEESALATAAANGASQVTSAVALNAATAPAQGAKLANLSDAKVTVKVTKLTTGDIDSICVTASKAGVDDQKAGPGCD